MKKAIFIIVLISALTRSFGQFGFCSPGSSLNLVCNPSFEYYISCPQHLSQLDEAFGWFECGIDPDYFHASTAGTEVAIPKNMYGYQYPHSGNGMAGMGTFFRDYPLSMDNDREYIGTKLIDTLKIGHKYYLSFWISFAEMIKGYQKIASNKTGMRFSTMRSGSGSARPPLNNFAHLYTNLIISDTINWYRISGSFIADSAYSHLTLGNFFDYLHVDTALVGAPIKYGRSWSYYYVDDVCVSEDSMTCSSPVGIRESQLYSINSSVYPNPAQTEITVQTEREGKYEFEIYNILGERLLIRKFNTKVNIDVSNLPTGTYLYFIKEDEIILKADKLLITY